MHRHAAPGFTLIELLIAIALAALLAAVALPSLRDAVLRARRSDALVPLMALQQAQERWRAGHAAYASLDELGLAAASPDGHYRRAVLGPSAAGYSVELEALGGQASDAACRHLRVDVSGGEARTSSGPTIDRLNGADTDRRCWGRP